ncbi:MAG: restriction endonuclease subunit S [Prolixibacteraceae bacterium]|nr:restriction endonuclease subunit S [Prolixibacteraceae bacterium]
MQGGNSMPNIKKHKLSDLCKMQSGGTPRRGNNHFYGGNIPWVKIGDIDKSNGLPITKTGEYITEEGLKSINNRVFKKGTLLLAMYGSVGKTAFAGKDLSTNQAILGINIIDQETLDKNFLKRWFDYKKIEILSKARGATLRNISATIVKNFQIPLPPIETQRRIAQILDKADALRRKNQQLLNTYDQLLQSTFLEMFGDPVTNPKGWEKKRLEEIINKIQIGPFGSQLHQADYVNDGIPLINPTNIINQRISLNSTVKISEEKYISLPQYHLEYGDIVMARRGDMSKVALVNIKGAHLFCGTGSLFVRFSQNTNKIFLHFLLSHEKTTKHLENEAIGVTMPNLNKKIIKNIPVYLPPITLQNQFAQIAENIEAQKSALNKSAEQSDDLFNSLIQQAFNTKPHTP